MIGSVIAGLLLYQQAKPTFSSPPACQGAEEYVGFLAIEKDSYKMKKLFLGALMAVTAVTSPLLMAKSNDKNDQEVINIYFARHGKTLLNSFDRVQGWIDSPLTKDGVQVAQYLGEGLKGIKFDRFYSSDAGRQRETMAVILKQAGVTDYHLTEMTGLREAFLAVLKAVIMSIWPMQAHTR